MKPLLAQLWNLAAAGNTRFSGGGGDFLTGEISNQEYKAMMRNCPFKGCKTRVKNTIFACPFHWKGMHLKAQALIWAAYNAYQAGIISPEALSIIQEFVMKFEQEKLTAKESGD